MRYLKTIAILAFLLVISGCGSSGSGGEGSSPAGGGAPAGGFVSYTQSLAETAPEDSEATDVDNVTPTMPEDAEPADAG